MDKLNSFWSYIRRDELDKKHRISNLLLLAGLFIQLPVAIINIVIGVPIEVYFVQAMIAIACVLFMWIANKYPKSQIPAIAFLTITNVFIYPYLYITAGGRKGGTLAWMMLGVLCVWILLSDSARYIMLFVDVVVIGLCVYTEEVFPDTIHYLDSNYKEAIDTIYSLVVVIVIIGVLIDYEIRLYEKKQAELEETERSLRDANDELHKINNDYQNASNAKSIFLANMSHELRTPINVVLGMSEMILRESRDENVLDYANDIDSAGHQLLSMINDIIDFTKIEAGKIELHPVEYELFSVLNDCYNIILTRAKKKELKVKVENDPALPAFLYGDEVRIRQIILNLLSNAVKYTKDGYVKMSFGYDRVTADTINLIIEIKDTGIGISPESQSVMFAAFTRLDEKNNRNIEGTGLGLSIVKHYVELMNGTIQVDSVVGEGSTFTVIVQQRIASDSPMGNFAEKYRHKEYLSDDPYKIKGIKEADSHKVSGKKIDGSSRLKAPEGSKNKGSFTAEGARILAVDDVKMNLNVVRLLLKNTKMEIDLAESGEEALKYTMMKHYDVILMDHMMPGMDGIETFHNIRIQRMGLNNTTPVIALTANAVQDSMQMYMKEGFSAYVTKPVKADVFEKELIRLLPKEKVILNEQDQY